MAGFGDFIGKAGGSAEQLFVWGVLNNIVAAAMTPFVQALTQAALEADPNTPLSPEDAAGLVARFILDQGSGEDQAKKSGLDPAHFDLLVKAAQQPPDLGMIIAAYQRQYIGVGSGDPQEVSLTGALAHNGVPAGWWELVTQLAVQIPSVAEVMNAWLEGQIEEDEARTRYLAAGGDPTWFQTSYNANGQAPTPEEALTMWNRGLIEEGGTGPGAVSYDQAFLEGPWRDKWLTAFKGLRFYRPPPRSITAMWHEGNLPQAKAEGYLADNGVPAEDYGLYLTAVTSKATTADKSLTRAEVTQLFTNGLITETEALADLATIGYHGDTAKDIIALAKLSATRSLATSAISRIKSLYLARKLTRSAAGQALSKVVVSGTDTTALFATWDAELAATVRQLTPAQIENALHYGIFDQATAQAELVTLGYTPYDAWVALSVRQHGPLPGKPPQGPATVGPLP